LEQDFHGLNLISGKRRKKRKEGWKGSGEKRIERKEEKKLALKIIQGSEFELLKSQADFCTVGDL